MTETLIDAIIILVYAALATALAAVAWSVWRGWRCRSRVKTEERMAQHTQLAVAAAVAAVVGVALLCSSAEPLTIAGLPFDSALWLRLADVFIYSIAILLAALAAAIVGLWMRSIKHSLRR